MLCELFAQPVDGIFLALLLLVAKKLDETLRAARGHGEGEATKFQGAVAYLAKAIDVETLKITQVRSPLDSRNIFTDLVSTMPQGCYTRICEDRKGSTSESRPRSSPRFCLYVIIGLYVSELT